MDKAVEIKRRAQRCVQNGDLDGALSEYEKLVQADGADPYNYVLIADLLYKKGDQRTAGERYLQAAESYETAGLYKNGIAVCKKMLRLSLGAGNLLKRLGSLHLAAGLGAEASLYYVQYAEQMSRTQSHEAAAEAFEKAFEAAPDNAKPLERAAEAYELADKVSEAVAALGRAAEAFASQGQVDDAERCRARAVALDPSAKVESAPPAGSAGPPKLDTGAPEPGVLADPTESPQAESAPIEAEAPAEPVAEEATEDAPAADANGPEPADTSQSAWEEAPASNGAPSLDFDGPAQDASRPAVEAILAEAQEHFKSGNRDGAADALSRAATAYEEAGHHDNAATIYRSLGKSAQVAREVLQRWYDNCHTRGDQVEASHVACEIGDRFMVDGNRDEAQKWFEQAIELDESNDLAVRRVERLTGQTLTPGAAPAAKPTPRPTPKPEAPAAAPAGDDELLGPEDAEAPQEPKPARAGEKGRVELAVGRGEAVTFDLGSLISEFQRGVEAQLSDDAQSHYDLAMAYREMGLLEQALDSFRIAAEDPKYAGRCAEMIGRCLLDQGRFEDAAQEFSRALQSDSTDTDTQISLRYQLGLAYEAAGRVQESLVEFEGVYTAQPNYPDVAMKIRVLRKSLENI